MIKDSYFNIKFYYMYFIKGIKYYLLDLEY